MSLSDDSIHLSRRAMLQGSLALSVLAGAAATALAQQKAAKNLVHYQEKPHDGQECDRCLQFLPPDSCKLVAGKINPKGWCLLFAPRPK